MPSPNFNHRITRYGAVAMVGATGALTGPVHAAVISQTGLHLAVPNTGTAVGLEAAPLGLPAVFSGFTATSSINEAKLKSPGVSSSVKLGSLSPGDVIGPSTSFAKVNVLASYTAGTLNMGTTTPVVGLALNHASFPSNIGYGWVSFSITDNGNGNYFDMTLTGWGYETTGAAITYLPEPSTLALAAAGLLGAGTVGARRRRRPRAA